MTPLSPRSVGILLPCVVVVNLESPPPVAVVNLESPPSVAVVNLESPPSVVVVNLEAPPAVMDLELPPWQDCGASLESIVVHWQG